MLMVPIRAALISLSYNLFVLQCLNPIKYLNEQSKHDYSHIPWHIKLWLMQEYDFRFPEVYPSPQVLV